MEVKAFMPGAEKTVEQANVRNESNEFGLEEDKVYHLKDIQGLRIAYCAENRKRTTKQVQKLREDLRNGGMISPAILVSASVAKRAGYHIITRNGNNSEIDVPDADLDKFTLLLDGNGRYNAYLLDCKESEDGPFDFKFVYKKYDDPTKLREDYIRANRVCKRTTSREAFRLMVNNDDHMAKCDELVEKGYIEKAAQIITLGREVKRADYDAVERGEKIQNINEDLIKGMASAYEVYEDVFCGKASEKVLHGTALAFWTKEYLQTGDSVKEVIKRIKKAFGEMKPRQLAEIQEAKGVKGDKTQTTAIVLSGLFGSLISDNELKNK